MSEVVTYGPFKKRQRRVHWCVVHDCCQGDFTVMGYADRCAAFLFGNDDEPETCKFIRVALVPVPYQRLPEGWLG